MSISARVAVGFSIGGLVGFAISILGIPVMVGPFLGLALGGYIGGDSLKMGRKVSLGFALGFLIASVVVVGSLTALLQYSREKELTDTLKGIGIYASWRALAFGVAGIVGAGCIKPESVRLTGLSALGFAVGGAIGGVVTLLPFLAEHPLAVQAWILPSVAAGLLIPYLTGGLVLGWAVGKCRAPSGQTPDQPPRRFSPTAVAASLVIMALVAYSVLVLLAPVIRHNMSAQPTHSAASDDVVRLNGYDPKAQTTVVIHYQRVGEDYDGWNLWVWPVEPNGHEGTGYDFTGSDSFGPYAVVGFKERYSKVGFLVRLRDWQARDFPDDRFIQVGTNGVAEIWLRSGQGRVFTNAESAETVSPAASGERESANLLRNAGFEIQGATADNALFWNRGNPDLHGGLWGSALRVNRRSHSGDWEGAIRGTSANAGDNGGFYQETAAIPGATYRVSGWFWADQTWRPKVQRLKLEFLRGEASGEDFLLQTWTDLNNIGETWVQATFEHAAPPNAQWVRLAVEAGEVGNAGALQFDDLSLAVVDAAHQGPGGAPRPANAGVVHEEWAVSTDTNTPFEWETDFAKASAEARKSGLHMLLDFTGSDWCGWCMRLDKEVFNRNEFKQFAKDNLVCVQLDFPRQKKLTKELEEQNGALAKKHGIRGFPTIVILSPEGETVGLAGYQEGGVARYVQGLKRMIDRNRDETRTGPEKERGMRIVQGDLSAPTNETERFHALPRAAKSALEAGKTEEARKLAEELGGLAPKYTNDWNYGNAIQDWNQVLGRIALAEGDIGEAKRRLLASADSKGSPVMNSFGPNMTLAKELLEKGEKDVVLQYFDRCAKFWKFDRESPSYGGRLDRWKAQVEKGEIPDFGPNLRY